MKVSEYIAATSRPYSSLLREVTISGVVFSSKQLPFGMEAQTQSNWCWAATATSVSHFYWQWSSWTQCLVANRELGRGDCCNSIVPSPCNVPWYLDRALSRTSNYVSMMGQASFQQARDEIDAGRPLGARIGWNGGGGHFMVIYGYSVVAGVEYFDIDDPIYGKSHLTVADFSSNYQGSGTWTHTYFTKSYIRMPIKDFVVREPILRRIWDVRPLLELKEDLTFRGDLDEVLQKGRASLGMAQRIYSLGLDSLMLEPTTALEPVGLRVYEMAEGKPRAFFDVSDEEEPRVVQMSASENHLEPFTRGLSQVLTTVDQVDEEAELRLFRVPALNFEALWVNYEGQSEDVLVPLRAVGRLTPYETVSLDEAFDALREAARPLMDMDDTMGA